MGRSGSKLESEEITWLLVPCATQGGRAAVTLTCHARPGAAGKQRRFGDGSPSDSPAPSQTHVRLRGSVSLCPTCVLIPVPSWAGVFRAGAWVADELEGESGLCSSAVGCGEDFVAGVMCQGPFPLNAPPAPLRPFTPSCKPLGLIAAAVLGEAVKAEPWGGERQ